MASTHRVSRRQFLRLAGVASGFLALPLLNACQQVTSTPAAEPKAAAPAAKTGLPTVRIQALSGGMTAVTLKAMEVSGLAEKNGFEIEGLYFGPDAATQQFLQRNSDVSTDSDVLTAALARNEGRKVVIFAPTINNNIVSLVKKDAPYNTITDLKGKRVGQIGLDSGTTTTFAVLMKRIFNLDYQKDFELVEASPPALIPLLDKGEVDTILHFDPYVSRTLREVPSKIIWGPFSEEWTKVSGAGITLSASAAHEDWVLANKELARNVGKAQLETLKWIPQNLNIFDTDEFKKLLGLKDPETIELVKKRVVEVGMWNLDWSEATRQAHQEFIAEAARNKVVIEKDPGGTVVDINEFAR